MMNDGILTFGSATVADFAECRGDLDAIRYLYGKLQKERAKGSRNNPREEASEAVAELISSNNN